MLTSKSLRRAEKYGWQYRVGLHRFGTGFEPVARVPRDHAAVPRTSTAADAAVSGEEVVPEAKEETERAP